MVETFAIEPKAGSCQLFQSHGLCLFLSLEKGGIFSNKCWRTFLVKTLEERVVSRIYGHGRGWSFSQKDFARLGARGAIDMVFQRLLAKGTIRRVIRGIYDYPRYSELLGQHLSPNLDAVAAALARKFGWRIEVTGPSALNLMGLSTQVPGRIVYASDGPDRIFIIGKQTLEFKHTALKEVSFKLRESFILVQGIKSLGENNVTTEAILAIRKWLGPELKEPVLADTKLVTRWVYDFIIEICHEEAN
jgi:hypothetical protein